MSVSEAINLQSLRAELATPLQINDVSRLQDLDRHAPLLHGEPAMRHQLRLSVDGLENKTLLSHAAAGLVAHHPVLQAEVQPAVTHKPSVVHQTESHKAHPADTGGYVFTTLDDPNAGTNGSGGYGVQGTFIIGINDRGQITGNYGDANYITHGLLLSHHKWTSFDDPSGWDWSSQPLYGLLPGHRRREDQQRRANCWLVRRPEQRRTQLPAERRQVHHHRPPRRR